MESIAPRIADTVGFPVLPMDSEGALFASFGTVAPLRRKSAFAVTGPTAVRWNCVKIVKAPAFWRGARSSRAVFAREWSPQVEEFRDGRKRACLRAFCDTPPLLLKEMRGACDAEAASSGLLFRVVDSGSSPAGGVGMGVHFGDAMDVRAAATIAVVILGIRSASETARLPDGDAEVDTEAGLVCLGANPEKNDQRS